MRPPGCKPGNGAKNHPGTGIAADCPEDRPSTQVGSCSGLSAKRLVAVLKALTLEKGTPAGHDLEVRLERPQHATRTVAMTSRNIVEREDDHG